VNPVQKKSKIGNLGTAVVDNPINYEYMPDSFKEFKPSIMTSKNSQSGKDEVETAPNLDKVDDKYLKRKGVDAHQLKKDVYGKKLKVAEYDIYVDKN